MGSASQRQKGRDRALSALEVDIQTLSIAKDSCGIPPAQAAFGSTGALLTTIRDSKLNEQDHVDIGLSCGGICRALDRGLNGRRPDDLNPSVLGAIEELTTTVAEIQRKIVKQGKRRAVSRVFHAKTDKDEIAGWQRDLNRILRIFNTELLINNHTMLSDIHRSALIGQDGGADRRQSVSGYEHLGFGNIPLPRDPPGELPPPPPRTCFGRDELVEAVVGFAENLEPIALVGAGGIGKTSIALKVLHHPRIKDSFGDNRRFIRCDLFPASHTHLLNRLSKVIGAGIENPEDLTPLRPSLSSSKMILFLDNAESILDPAGPDAQETYRVVEELTRFENICLGITSRISTVPPHCNCPIIPTLSMESACDIFYSIHNNVGRSAIISDLVGQLDFHALSITLLATVAFHNRWDHDQVAKEWDIQRAQVLQTDHNESLATTIELSLASETFRKLTPSPFPSPSRPPHEQVIPSIFNQLTPSSMSSIPPPSARELLEVVAFFPQGVDENNLDWLFPTTSDRKNIFNKFCILSLTYRSNGFIAMLAPIRDYLTPKDPKSSPLLCATKDRYFSRLSVDVNPNWPGFEEARWIMSEDVNVEHLLDVSISTDPDADDIWDTCHCFMKHLYWHKPRQTVLGPRIEALSDDHPSKPKCLSGLSSLFSVLGNREEQKRLLTHALMLERQRGDEAQVAKTLRLISDANRILELYEEGIKQAEEALEIWGRLGNTFGQATCLNALALLLFEDKQLDAAETAASRAIDLLPEEGEEYKLSQLHQVLGKICKSRREKGKAIRHFETAIGIATRFNWHDELFWIHVNLARLFRDEEEFDNANAHIEQAKSLAIGNTYNLGRAMEGQGRIWRRQGRLEDARSETLRALEVFERLGAAVAVRDCRDLLKVIELESHAKRAYHR